MERKNGPWTIKETELKYRNDFIEVRQDQVIQPDGKPGAYATVTVKPGVAILAVGDNDEAYLTSQFRYALGEESLEAVSGAVDEGESPQEAARRELREELGIDAGELIDLGQLCIDTSIIKAPVTLFLARKLTFIKPQREGSETIKTVRMKFNEVVEAVMKGRIVHGPSCVLTLKASRQNR